MNWLVAITILGAIIGSFSSIAYIRTILKGQSKPHRVTWGGWTLVGILGIVSSIRGGAGIGLVVAAVFVAWVAVIFVLSCFKKYGKPGGTRLDYIAGAIAALALLTLPLIDYSPNVGQTIAIAADLVFLWPTLREAWFHPEYEAVMPWALGAVGEAMGVLALGAYTYAAAGYSVYILLGNLTVVAVLKSSPYRKKRVRKARK